MKITNKFNLPEPLVRACQRHTHRGENYSASMLGNTPQMVWLKRRHEAELTEDVSDRIWSLFGTAFHGVLEGNGGPGDITELYMETEPLPGIKLSGSCDLFSLDKAKVSDYKTTSAWSIVYGSKNEEWTAQLNVYGYMARKHGLPVKELEIVALLRDWDKKKAGGKYPDCQVVSVPIELWTDEKCEAYIKERITLIEACKDVPDALLPLCTAEERWDRGKGSVRCEGYCSCNVVCKQYAKIKGGK